MLFAAWGILFAHSVVPHHHTTPHQLLRVEICQQDVGVLSFLEHVFHFSTGQDHLEEFNLDQTALVFLAPAQSTAVSAWPALTLKHTFYSTVKSSASRYRQGLLRAPPALS